MLMDFLQRILQHIHQPYLNDNFSFILDYWFAEKEVDWLLFLLLKPLVLMCIFEF